MDSWAGSDSARVAYRAFVLEGLENGTPPPTTAVTET
jgi:hypothetical protein